jgi:signal transduction histidine kinase
MFHSLRARLWLSYAFLIAVALTVVGLVLVLFLLRDPLLYRKTFLRLATAQTLVTDQTQSVVQLSDVARTLDVRVLLFDASGRLVQDSSGNQPALPLPANPLNLRAIGMQRDLSGRPWFYSVKQLSNGGWLVIAAPRPKVAPVLAVLTDELSAPFLEGGLIALLFSLVLAYVIARWVAGPLEQVIAAARIVPPESIPSIAERGPREVRELTRAFNAMVARVSASRTAQRDFVANVSHELKTPLTSIQGFAQALMDGTAQEPDERRQAAQVIYNEAGRMHRMALDLLDLARLDAGTAELKKVPVDMLALLRSVCDKFQPMALEAGVDLQMALPPNLPPLMGDGDRLAQVFSNLVDNALKFTPAGGSVTIRTMQEQGEIQVSVIDTGKGIPPSALPHIFDRFYRGDSARTGGDGRGAGLGLAIAHEVVAAHGGRISVRSAEGRGTGFVVHLPLK